MLTTPRPVMLEPFPLPGRPPEWVFVAGSWGDVLCACGNVERLLEHTGQHQVRVLCFGESRAIAAWLALQPWADEVRWLPADDRAHYLEVLRWCGEQPDGAHWLPELLRGTPVRSVEVWPCQIDFSLRRYPEVWRPERLTLPESVRAWAADRVPDGAGLWLLQPRSEANCPWHAHYAGWGEAVRTWLDQGRTLLLCGQGFDGATLFGPHPRLINAVNRTPSVLHVWALAERCALTLTTGNSLGHWCASRGLPAVVALNRMHARPQQYFTRFLAQPPVRVVEYGEPLAQLLAAVE